MNDECLFAYRTGEVPRVTAVLPNDHRRHRPASAPECDFFPGFELFRLLHGFDWSVHLTGSGTRMRLRHHGNEKERSEKAARDFADDVIFHCVSSFV
jgi:hypothetical protein